MSGKILILGTLHWQTEAMEVLKDLGWTVYACSYRREGPGVDFVDDFFLVDILDIPEVTALASRLDVDCVYCVGSDIAMPTVAIVSEKLGLPLFHSAEITDILHRKVRLRDFLKSKNLSSVSYLMVKTNADLKSFSNYPAIVKPADSQGQRGMTRVNSLSEAEAALKLALQVSPTSEAIIEEWLDGREISVHVFVINGEIKLYIPSDRISLQGLNVGIPKAHGLPAKFLDNQSSRKVKTLIYDFVANLRIINGPLYFQIILTPRGPRIVEVAPRLDGCHLWRLIYEWTGFNLLAATFTFLLEGKWEDPDFSNTKTTYMLNFHLADAQKPFHAKDFPSESEGRLCYQEYQLEENEFPRDTGSSVVRVGYFIEELA